MKRKQKGFEIMGLISLTFRKLKAFRMTIPSLILLVLASYRTLMSGYSIELVGICASVVPFICQFRNFPEPSGQVSMFQEVLSNYILNLILMILYLAYVLVLTFLGSSLIPSYAVNPHFTEMLLLAVCANVVFISVIIPICHDLKPMQRMMPGILMCNAQLIFMMLAGDYVEKAVPGNLKLLCCGFAGLILVLTLGFMKLCYSERKK